MRYLKEIVKAVRDGRHLPGPKQLIAQYKRWRLYQHNRNVMENAMPWITFSAIDFLSSYLNSSMTVFEFGGGGSSLFFASRTKKLVTVEHNKEWFNELEKEMASRKQALWQGFFVEGEWNDGTKDLSTSNPDHYFSGDLSSKGKSFKKYASVIDQFPDASFDVILVDGRARPSCMKHSVSKVKIGGYLILDNAERSYYLTEIGKDLKDYKLISDYFGPLPYASSFTQTNIWQRIH